MKDNATEIESIPLKFICTRTAHGHGRFVGVSGRESNARRLPIRRRTSAKRPSGRSSDTPPGNSRRSSLTRGGAAVTEAPPQFTIPPGTSPSTERPLFSMIFVSSDSEYAEAGHV